uniref:retinitis pigmentosa 1-like 1 protein n=1 Tax=Scatophagus argus TaxID=75038 RepID=UPI001ED81DA4|nr:retinitis pigmentosa 1-like 1 protein [Scatophagus argus]
MHSVQGGMWDPRPPSKHASPLPQPTSNLRLAHVTTATPAKRITFYKSGDSQFGGIRMAVHKRSFKCFDALLDDLSQKMPLPFGVRTVTTPRGTHTIKHLEQLQDGGCYLCTDRRQAKPVNMELANKRPNIWYHHSQRPHRPESSATLAGHLPYRQRRILLVKNSEPGMRRSVVLSRRSARSLRAFLDEVSEVMQFHVRKLYTAEGRRIDSVQSLMTCPGVLVCVGREAFSPMLVNFIRKSSEEKLPGLGPRTPGNGARSPATQGARSPPHGAQSRASEYSEGHESKKNVNFGLETKKSIIHPRSDSSNRSARFSLSSEKSYGNGVSTYSQARPSIMNEDIEKRVLVNKDGSLSVEMRVRFRLHNDETLQWSTQIKKSPSLTTECCPLSQAPPHYLQQGQSESSSDPDSTSFDPEGVDYSSQPLQRVSEGNQCPCCYQRQEQQYDLWENPVHSHKQPPVPPPHTASHTHTMRRHTHSSSSSSSCNSRRVVRCRARLSNCGGGSGSEQSQLVQEEMCVTEQVERRVEVEQDGDTHVEVCKVSRCCSRSEVVALDSNLRPLSQKSVEDELITEEGGDRPLSAISSSSNILQSLKEDLDDDLPRSASQCCNSNGPSPSPAFETHPNDKPTSEISAGSVHPSEHKEGEERGSRAVSAACSCHCGAATPNSTAGAEEMERAPSSKARMSRASCRSSKANIPISEEDGAADDEDEDIKRVVSGLSGHTGLSAGSQSRASSVCPNCGGYKHEINSLSNSRVSQRSHQSHPASPKPPTPLSNQENAHNGSDDEGSDVSAVSTQSNKTNLTNHGRISAISNALEARASSAMSMSDPEEMRKEEERTSSVTSATSHRSNRSHKSGCNDNTGVTTEKEEERSPSAMSAQSSKSHKSNCSGTAEAPDIRTREEAEGETTGERALSSLSAKSGASSKTRASVKLTIMVASPTDNTAVKEDDTNKRSPSALSGKSNVSDKPDMAERPDSVLSAASVKSNASAKSGTSHRSTCSHCARAVSTGPKEADEPVMEATRQEEGMEERAVSAMSAKSNLSAKSNKSCRSTKASERSLSPRLGNGGDLEKRAASQMSCRSVKSNNSVQSSKSCKSNYNGCESAQSPSLREANDKETEMVVEETQQRAGNAMSAEESEKAQDRTASALSGKSASSAKSHHTNCDVGSLVAPGEDTAKTKVDNTENRTPSVMSGKSHTSAKSHKSQMSNCTAASPNPNKANAETNGEEKQNQERVASALSVKSKSSARSNTSNKSNSRNIQSVSPNPNAVIIKTSEGVDEEGNDTTERALSTAADIAHVETADTDEKVGEDIATRSKSSEHCQSQSLSPKAPDTPPSSPQSPVQQLLPGPSVGETRGSSALSVHSVKSSKSGRSKCCCGNASAKKGKEKVDKEVEEKEDSEEVKSEKASERAASVMSSSTQRQRKESEGTEQALSRNSSGSVSLGLPEDHETGDSDSGKSSVSFHVDTENKSRVKTATPNALKRTVQSDMKDDVEGTGSTMSQQSNNNGSKNTLSHIPPVNIPTIETPGGNDDKGDDSGKQETVRASSAFSSKSIKSHKYSCKCSVKAATPETESVQSASTTKASDTEGTDNRSPSAMSSGGAKVRNKSPSSVSIKKSNVAKTTAGDSANDDTEIQAVSRPSSKAKVKQDTAGNKAASVHSKSPCCLRPESAASAQSDSLNPVIGPKVNSSGSVKTSSSKKNETPLKSSSPCPIHSSRPGSKVTTCSESILSHSLSAADLLKETMATARPRSQQSKASKTSDKPRSEKSGKIKNETNQEEMELTPACLPNASPSEVVSDWLRSIPANSSMLTFGDELHEEEQEKAVEEKPGEEEAKGEEGPEDKKVDEEEKVQAGEEGEKEEGHECDTAEEAKGSEPAPGDAVGTSSHFNNPLLSTESLPRNWHSSAAVMKVLLSPSLGRCQSMPEVSPVYGRRLSTSARGFLDCLAQLQLIEPAVSPGSNQQKDRQYEDIMAILQSLWLTEPRDIEAKEVKDAGKEQVTPPRSSSGVDMSSGSGSGKNENENGNQGEDETEQNKTNEGETLHEDKGAEKVVEEEEEEEEEDRNAVIGHKEIEAEPEETEEAQTEIAEELVQSEEQSTVPPSLDSPKATDNPSSSDKSSANDSSKSPTDNERETLDSSSGTPPTVLRAPLSKKISQDPDPVWILHLLKKLEKQFMNHYSNAMLEFKVRWELDDSIILDTMISELRDEVSRRIQSSIEREMRKIQSRAGRAGRSPQPPKGANLSRESTMTEKRRRMLRVMKNQSVKTADSLSDGELTGEFSDQRSDDEYCPCDACVRKKMAARPLKVNPLATEAPVMMEFDLLKILQLKKSPSPSAVPPPAEKEGDSLVVDEEGRNLEAVQEEEEEDETKEDIKADVVLEETIPEEDEEIEKEENGGEAGDEEVVEGRREDNSVSDEEQEEGETGGEEGGEEETSDNAEDEEEDEAQCQCQCAKGEEWEEEGDKAGEVEEGEEETAEGEEETTDNTGEDETADNGERAREEDYENAKDEGETEGNEGETGTGEEEEEEESDKETVKEATVGEEETNEKGRGEEEEEAEVQECEVTEFKAEEEEEKQTVGRGSRAESGETEDAAKNAANEESTPVEESTEGNESASAEAEDEDDGDDGSREGESHEQAKGGESEEQERKASEEERASSQGQGVTEGEEVDAEDSDTDGKRPSVTSESGREGAGATGDEEDKDSGGDGGEDEVVEDVVEEIKPEEEKEEEEGQVNRNKREDCALLHQFTRTSVESQPGSLEDIDADAHQNPANSAEVSKMATGVSTSGDAGQRGSRSPARVKRRQPKESDVELDDF